MRFKPQRARRRQGIDCSRLPPRRFIAVTMELAMMSSAQRHCEFVTDLATERGICAKRR